MADYNININAKDNTGSTLNKIEGKLDSLGKQGNSTFGGLKGSTVAWTAAIGAAVAGVVKLGTATIDATRKYENLQNQLRLVTNSTAELATQTDRLRKIAIQNRTSFEATAELYTKLRVATEDLGFSSEKVEKLTTKMSQALQVAGADANTASGVIRQFGQAMSSGVVRGDEFNSIVEGLGPALSIMARESGLTTGKLREMAGAGELTAQKFSELLLNSNALTESFNKMTPSISSLETALGDAFDRFLVDIGEASGLTDAYKWVLGATTDTLTYFSDAMSDTNEEMSTNATTTKTATENMKAYGEATKKAALSVEEVRKLLGNLQTKIDPLDIRAKTLVAVEKQLTELENTMKRMDEAGEPMSQALMDRYNQLFNLQTQLEDVTVAEAEWGKVATVNVSELKRAITGTGEYAQAMYRFKNAAMAATTASNTYKTDTVAAQHVITKAVDYTNWVYGEQQRQHEELVAKTNVYKTDATTTQHVIAKAVDYTNWVYAEQQRQHEALIAKTKKYKTNAVAAQHAISKGVDYTNWVYEKQQELHEESVAKANESKKEWQSFRDGMVSSITDGIMSGKGLFNSFGDFLKGWAQKMISQVLEKYLIGPMVDQMGSFLGMGGGAAGGIGGFGGFGGGGFNMSGLFSNLSGMFSGLFGNLSGMFSGLWGGISSFFGNIFGGFFADGGYLPSGKVGIVGEAGPELISGPANITPMGDAAAGPAPIVNFNINAIDTQSGTEFILNNKRQIEGVIQSAYNRRGKAGIYD